MNNRNYNSSTADLVILDCRFSGFASIRPHIEAIAVTGNLIAGLGTNQDIRNWIGDKTQVLNARGYTVLPGFIDSHVHFVDGGFSISRVQLRDAATPDEFIRRIEKFAGQLPVGEWVLGGRWDHELWSGSPLPAKEWIDECTPNNPVFIDRYDGHMALANSRALLLAGITRDTADPPGGRIERGEAGEPTGILKDEAMEIVGKVIPDPSEGQKTQAIRAALAEARRFGITGIHDNVSAEDLAIYRKLYEQGELTCRIHGVLPIQNQKPRTKTGARATSGDYWIRPNAVKAFADGSLGSSTALFFQPYNDAPGNPASSGLAMHTEDSLLKMVLEADQHGLQVCTHAIGDKANHLVLDIYEAVANSSQDLRKDRRFRIEHAQHLHPADIARFGSLSVIASMQPIHLVDDGRWAEKRIGHDRCKTAFAFRSLLNQGARLAFGTDWPVAPLNPLLGILAAAARQTSDGKHPGGWFPDEKITLEEAIQAYTLGSAYAEFEEKEKGSLTVGKLADIVVLNADINAIPIEMLKQTEVLATIVDGKVVYLAENN